MTGQSFITLANGVAMPALGLGVLDRDRRELTADAVETAIAAGYRLIDTAASYLNEAEVGEGIRRAGLPRDQLFVSTKLWLSNYGYDSTLRACAASLRRLGLDHVDLYMLHWPVPMHFDATVESWRAAARLLAEGRARAIGVANFGPEHLRELIERTGVTPAVNQVEVHPLFTQKAVCMANAELGIVTQAWAPIGGSVRKFADPSRVRDPLADPTIAAIAAQHGRTPAQVILRWHIQQGRSAIPKSFTKERIVANFAIFDFTLDAAELAAIDALDTGRRSGANPAVMDASKLAVVIED